MPISPLVPNVLSCIPSAKSMTQIVIRKVRNAVSRGRDAATSPRSIVCSRGSGRLWARGQSCKLTGCPKEPFMIEVAHLVKRFGAVTAVDGLSFTVRPGHVTGFLGPNGAGKTTTMRVILGLDAPTSGRSTHNGKPPRDLGPPLRELVRGGGLGRILIHLAHRAGQLPGPGGDPVDPQPAQEPGGGGKDGVPFLSSD